MNDPQRIVDEIRAFLQASDQSFKPRLRELGAEYAEGCSEVNRRLARCAQLIKQGLRAEAIHIADADPNLLTTLADLDFSERDGWIDLVAIYDLPAPPDLDLANAEHLNAAYAEHDPLKNLMKKHRKLALARAPLRDRLAVLREFARLDPGSPIWSEDIKTYELERFKQILSEANDAARRCDSVTADALEYELDGVAWSTTLPAGLARGVKRAAELVRQETAKRALPEAEERLNAAFSALDPAMGRQARARWNALAETARLAPDDSARERAQPALLWVAEQDRITAARAAFDAAAFEFDEALNDPTAPREELESLWQALNKMGVDVPRALAQRYTQRIDGFDSSKKKKAGLIMGAMAATVFLLLGGGTAGYLYNAGVQERQAAAASIQSALDQNKVEDLETLVKRLKSKQPSVYNSAEVQEILPEVKRAQNKEEERAGKFKTLISEAESGAINGAEPEAMKEARKQARTASEKAELEELDRQITQRNTEESAKRERELAPILAEVDNAANEVEKSLRNAVAVDPKLRSRITAARLQLDSVSPPAGPTGKVTLERVEKLRDRLSKSGLEATRIGRRSQAAEVLTVAVRQLPQGVDAYVNAAEKLKAEYGQETQGTDIGKLLADPERSTWESALRWSLWADEWAAKTGPLDPVTARTRFATCTRFLKEQPRCPDPEAVRRYMSYLKPVADRDEPAGGLSAKLKKTLSGPSMNNLYMVRYKKNPADKLGSLRYYSQIKPNQFKMLQFDYLTDTDGTRKNVILADEFIVGPRELSPQSKLVLWLNSKLGEGPAVAAWDATMLEAAGKASNDPDMDPICKLILLNELLKTAAEGSQALKEALGPTLAAVARASAFRTVQWIDPDAKVDEQRANADTIVKNLPPWTRIASAAAVADARLLKSVGETHRPVGWISRKSPGFTVRFVDPNTKPGDLPLFVATPEKGNGVWKTLGRVVNGAGDLFPEDPSLAAEGRLVFIRSAASDNTQRNDR